MLLDEIKKREAREESAKEREDEDTLEVKKRISHDYYQDAVLFILSFVVIGWCVLLLWPIIK